MGDYQTGGFVKKKIGQNQGGGYQPGEFIDISSSRFWPFQGQRIKHFKMVTNGDKIKGNHWGTKIQLKGASITPYPGGLYVMEGPRAWF